MTQRESYSLGEGWWWFGPLNAPAIGFVPPRGWLARRWANVRCKGCSRWWHVREDAWPCLRGLLVEQGHGRHCVADPMPTLPAAVGKPRSTTSNQSWDLGWEQYVTNWSSPMIRYPVTPTYSPPPPVEPPLPAQPQLDLLEPEVRGMKEAISGLRRAKRPRWQHRTKRRGLLRRR